MEGFGNVRRRVLDHDLLAFARQVRAVLGLPRRGVMCEIVDLGEDEAVEGWGAACEVEEGLVVDDVLDPLVGLEL